MPPEIAGRYFSGFEDEVEAVIEREELNAKLQLARVILPCCRGRAPSPSCFSLKREILSKTGTNFLSECMLRDAGINKIPIKVLHAELDLRGNKRTERSFEKTLT